MTERKPAGLRTGSWVEQQIRAAEQRGLFDNLPGAGQPLPGIDRPRSELHWAADLARRENLDLRAMLPPALALAKEREDLPRLLAAQRTERNVRELAQDFNDRVREAHRRPAAGPPLTARPVDVDTVVQRWRDQRASAVPAATPAVAPPSAGSTSPRVRHLLARLLRRSR